MPYYDLLFLHTEDTALATTKSNRSSLQRDLYV